MAHHAVHILLALGVLLGLFVGSWALERRPLPARDGEPPSSRASWERRLSGMGLAGPHAPVRPLAARAPTPLTALPWNVARRWAAALSLLAATIHLAVVPEHLRESGLFAVFFIACGAFQAGAGLAMGMRPTRRLYVIVATVNAAVVALWVLSRTAGVPLGPQPWVPEHVGALDAVASACEIALVGIAVLLYRRTKRRPSLVICDHARSGGSVTR